MKSLKEFFAKFNKEINSATFPPSVTCDCCRNDIFVETYPAICEKCFATLPFIHNPCTKCGKPIKNKKCDYCNSRKLEFKNAYAVFQYVPPISEMIFRFKYNKEFHLKNFFTYFMINKFNSLNLNIDCVVGVPMHRDKEIIRIKNQATLLAEEFALKTNIYDASNKLMKIAQTTQTSLDTSQRFENVKNSLLVIDKKFFKSKNVLIIDDVLTTGSTANAISKKIYECGAKNVYVLTIASS